MADFSKALRDLEQWLNDVSPDMLDDLEPPATGDSIARLCEAYNNAVPQDVITLYKWHDGGQIPDPWWELNDIESILNVKELHASIPELYEEKNWWSDRWIPIGADGAGNHLCVDLDGCFGGLAGQLLIFMHDEGERTIVAPSLDGYIQTLIEACLTGVLNREDEGFMSEENEEAWAAFLARRLEGYPRVEMTGE